MSRASCPSFVPCSSHLQLVSLSGLSAWPLAVALNQYQLHRDCNLLAISPTYWMRSQFSISEHGVNWGLVWVRPQPYVPLLIRASIKKHQKLLKIMWLERFQCIMNYSFPSQDLTLYPRLSFSSQTSLLSLQRARIVSMHRHTWLNPCF